jgi:prepilin-type N-terminal cleavage/methylation domain-containing protein
MKKLRKNGFTMVELLITIAIFAVFLLFFIQIFNVIQTTLLINKKLTMQMYGETQVENAFSVIAKELQWGGSMYGNIHQANFLDRNSSGTAILTEFMSEPATTILPGSATLTVQYAQVEKGILRKLESYPNDIYTDSMRASFTELTPGKYATRTYFAYIQTSFLRTSESYLSQNASNLILSLDNLTSTTAATLTWWVFSTDYEATTIRIPPSSSATGIYFEPPNNIPSVLDNYILTIAYQLPESNPVFEGIQVSGATRPYFGEIIAKTTFSYRKNSPDDGWGALVMEKYIPTVHASNTLFKQDILWPVKDLKFTMLENEGGVKVEFVYGIEDPTKKGTTVWMEYKKQRTFWNFGVQK